MRRHSALRANSIAPVARLRLALVNYLVETEQYEVLPADGARVRVFEQIPRTLRRAGAALELHVRPADLMVIESETRASA